MAQLPFVTAVAMTLSVSAVTERRQLHEKPPAAADVVFTHYVHRLTPGQCPPMASLVPSSWLLLAMTVTFHAAAGRWTVRRVVLPSYLLARATRVHVRAGCIRTRTSAAPPR